LLKLRLILTALLLALAFAACGPQIQTVITVIVTATPGPTGTPTVEQPTPTWTPVPTITPRPTQAGATPMPEAYNPLTGQFVKDPAVLMRRPLVTKISNESQEVRPQSGLSFADHVWEYQMEGFQQTRYTAIFYSRAPEQVGSVRSARLIDVHELMFMYDGLLVYSGCSIGVCWQIQNATWGNSRAFREDKIALVRISGVPREGISLYHTLFALPDKVWSEANEREVNGRPNLQPMHFDPNPPPKGVTTHEFVIDYPALGPRHRWEYNEANRNWLSFTTDQRQQADEEPDIDFATKKQLAFDNVVLIYADHSLADYLEDEANQLSSVEINLQGEGDAVLMRDGKRYNCRWVRHDIADMIALVDSSGNPIPLKPGTTWFNVYSANMFQPDVSFSAQ